jgi:hypothetical protein
MLQFSLRNLLIAVAFCAFGAAALVNANSWWVAISWSAALFSLATAGLLAVHRREEKRAFCSGYTSFGTLYVLLLMYSIQPTSSSNSSVLCLNSLSYYNLLTTKLTTWTYSHLPATLTTEYQPAPNPGPGGPGGSSGGSMGPVPMAVPSPYGPPPMNYGSSGLPMSGGGPMGPAMPGMMGGAAGYGGVPPNPRFVDQSTYTEVGHALWIILIASLGGAISCWAFSKKRQESRTNLP